MPSPFPRKDLNGQPLLGSTMALFGSGMSYGHSHGNANLPLVLAGGSDLGLKHGRHLDFNQGYFNGYQLDKPSEHYAICSRPVNTAAHMSNLLLLMAQRMGVETDQFGDRNKVVEPDDAAPREEYTDGHLEELFPTPAIFPQY